MNNETHTSIKSYFQSGNMDKINENMAVSKFEHKSNSDILMAWCKIKISQWLFHVYIKMKFDSATPCVSRGRVPQSETGWALQLYNVSLQHMPPYTPLCYMHQPPYLRCRKLPAPLLHRSALHPPLHGMVAAERGRSSPSNYTRNI